MDKLEVESDDSNAIELTFSSLLTRIKFCLYFSIKQQHNVFVSTNALSCESNLTDGFGSFLEEILS